MDFIFKAGWPNPLSLGLYCIGIYTVRQLMGTAPTTLFLTHGLMFFSVAGAIIAFYSFSRKTERIVE